MLVRGDEALRAGFTVAVQVDDNPKDRCGIELTGLGLTEFSHEWCKFTNMIEK